MRNKHWWWRNYLILLFALLLAGIFGYGIFVTIRIPDKMHITWDEQDVVARLRALSFVGSLKVSAEVSSVELQLDQFPHHVLNMQTTLANNSWRSLLIKKPTAFGFGNIGTWCDEDVVHKIYKDNGELIEMANLGADCFFPNVPQSDDFESLEQGETLSYLYQIIPANMSLDDDDGLDHILTPGSYYIRATYDNLWIGYESSTDSSASVFIDMNAWVGEVSSDRISFVVPPYELPTETATP